MKCRWPMVLLKNRLGVWFSVAANVAGVLQSGVSAAEAVVKTRIDQLADYLKAIPK